MAKVGSAFSGGGVRSASFCSGVLRRLLQHKADIDYLSCVSGGGYTGTSYLDWKYRHGKKDDKTWHQEFFEHMRSRSGIFCNWQKPSQGIIDSIILFTLVFFVALVIPILLWSSYACPLAFVIDYLFGDILRNGQKPCMKVIRRHPKLTLEQCRENRRLADEESMEQEFYLFALPVIICIVSYGMKGLIRKGAGFFLFLSTSCAVFFGLVFIPWFIDEFLRLVPKWIQIAILLCTFIVWFMVPLIRRNATLVIILYLYSFVIYWRVYNENAFGIEYNQGIFDTLMWISILLLWSAPIIGTIQQRIGHVYNRWRIQRAFYTPQSIGRCGCGGISWRDLFLRCPSFHSQVQGIHPEHALSLEDLDDVKPIYIGCVTINKWRRTTSPKEPHYELLMMTPQGIQRLDRPPEEREFDGKLMPVDVFLSDAMATSAAAVDHHMGKHQEGNANTSDLKVMLGIAMGTTVVADLRHEDKRNCCIQLLPLLIEVCRILPLLVFLIIYYQKGRDEFYLSIGILTFFVILVLLSLLALVPTGSCNPGRLERIARWFTINVAYVSFIRKTINMVNQGPNPPPVLRLSDGGHIENLGILPLLKLRLKRIVSVNGGRTSSDEDYGKALLAALEMARKKLGCSFSGLDGRDIAEDIRDKFVEKSPGCQPSSYRFKVDYYEKNATGDGRTKVGEGEVLFIAPRHPGKAIQTKSVTKWSDLLRDIDVDLEEGWGPGPELTSEEAERLTFCCCERCHGNTCRGLSEWMCGAFPQHITGNQFYTPAMYTAYHREGYRACMEAKADEFMAEVRQAVSLAATAY